MTTCLLKGPISLTDGLKCIELFMLPEEMEEVKVNFFHVKNEQKSCTGPLKMDSVPYLVSSTLKTLSLFTIETATQKLCIV